MGDTWWYYWLLFKDWVDNGQGVSTDQHHVHLGIAVILSIAVPLGLRRHGPSLAWLVVALRQGLNEMLDTRVWIECTRKVNWSEAISDTVLTLFWLTILLWFWKWLKHPNQSAQNWKSQCE